MLRLAADFYRLTRRRATLEECIAAARERLRRRDANLLEWLRRHVYARGHGPYAALLRHAGIEHGDVVKLVHVDGLEAALQRLRSAGVYLTYEEFRGRRPLVRGSLRIEVRETDFDNPSAHAHVTARSSGSTGARVSAPLDMRAVREFGEASLISHAVSGVQHAVCGLWSPPPPDHISVLVFLWRSMVDVAPVERWFAPLPASRTAGLAYGALGLSGLRWLGRLAGRPIPPPEHVPFDRADVVARWTAGMLAAGRPPVLQVGVSPALAVVQAARADGLELGGAMFRLLGEPVTAARAAQFQAMGVRITQTYAASEVGWLADSCGAAGYDDDMHLLTDRVAVITHGRSLDGIPVEPFLYTSLPAHARKLLLNVEIDDTGELFSKPCGCLLEKIGYTVHVRGVRSISKLTSHGRNVLGADIVRIMEETLPARFGGSPVHYQMVEEEGADGLPRLILRVHPEVGPLSDADLVTTVLDELRKGRPSYGVAADLWQQAEALRVERRAPLATGRGKVLPLYFAGRRAP
jgi:phenylacetate-coenzyme A ligase PaaK-like adenylate-forming protein